MNRPIRIPISGCVAVVLSVSLAGWVQESSTDPLAQAKALFNSAEYERALDALHQVTPANSTPKTVREGAVYRALCLLGLDRTAEAEIVIDRILDDDPFFTPGPDVTPRMRGIVDEVRERVRPTLVQKHYKTGKEHFDRGDHPSASSHFEIALRLIDETPSAQAKASFEDFRILAVGFRDLIDQKRAAAVPPTPEPPATVPAARETEPVTLPPVPIRQDIPPPPASVATALRGRTSPLEAQLEFVIDEQGRVKSVRVVRSVHPVYDAVLVAAARRWSYLPATRDGVPVQFTKQLGFNVNVQR